MTLASRRLRFMTGALFVTALIAASPGFGADLELFGPHDSLALELDMDMKSLCRKSDAEDCEDTPASLIYTDEDGRSRNIEVQVRARGNWRRERKNCSTPPLFIRFTEDSVTGTPFEGQSLLPLTTHCRKGRSKYEQYLLKEYLGYRIYNLLSDTSLRVRLVRMTYRDSSRDSRPLVRYAFLTEHFDSLASRHGAAVWKPEAVDPRRLDSMNLGIVSLYQYMIGNTDWSLVYHHNILAVRTDGGAVSTVPYDLDFSGLVNAAYAGPSPKLSIRSVRQRVFRGFCRDDIDWSHLFAWFEDRRDAVLELAGQIPGLNAKSQRDTRSFLEKFYRTLESEDRRRKKIVGACRRLPAEAPQIVANAPGH